LEEPLLRTKIDMKKIVLMAGIVVFIASCKKDDAPVVTNDEKKEVIANYAAIVHASYEDAYNAALNLKAKIDAFVATPTNTNFEACKTAWKESRLPYGQSEAYRFYEGPIDDATNGPEGLLNAWPMDESYVDYITGNATSGIINDPVGFPAINKAVLEAANENGSETNIATGYHAIEFLLWGQDKSATGPGSRPYTDYVTGAGGTALNQARRGTYLKVAADLLVENLLYLVNEWKTGGTYRTQFTTTLNADSALTFLVRGIGELSKGELAGERMTVALTNQDQEDEHSCFSDNTHIDIQMNFTGIENVYKGEYKRTSGATIKGKSLSDIVGKLNAEKNNAVLAQFTDARTKVFAIPAPFDQQIIGDPGGKVVAAINSLRSLSDKIADGVFVVGVRVSF
jgi:putative iron-regulated protein